MAGSNFFKRGPGLALAEIVALTGARPEVQRSVDLVINDVAALELAGPTDISFADQPDDAAVIAATHAGACFVTAEFARALPAKTVALISVNPYRAFVQVANALYPNASRPSSLFEIQGNAAGATIHRSARIESNVTIDPTAMVGPRAEMGFGTVVNPMAVIGPDVRIGRDCLIGSGASVVNTLIGDHVVIRAGCRLGDDNPINVLAGREVQFGRVILQDGVQLGANCTIDRGSHLDTVLGEHTIVDSLVRIPADVSIGRYCKISLMRGPQRTDPEILSTFRASGVLPDRTTIDAHSIALFGAR